MKMIVTKNGQEEEREVAKLWRIGEGYPTMPYPCLSDDENCTFTVSGGCVVYDVIKDSEIE